MISQNISFLSKTSVRFVPGAVGHLGHFCKYVMSLSLSYRLYIRTVTIKHLHKMQFLVTRSLTALSNAQEGQYLHGADG